MKNSYKIIFLFLSLIIIAHLSQAEEQRVVATCEATCDTRTQKGWIQYQTLESSFFFGDTVHIKTVPVANPELCAPTTNGFLFNNAAQVVNDCATSIFLGTGSVLLTLSEAGVVATQTTTQQLDFSHVKNYKYDN